MMLVQRGVLLVALATQSLALFACGFVAPTPFLHRCTTGSSLGSPLFSDVGSAVSSTAQDEADETVAEQPEIASTEEDEPEMMAATEESEDEADETVVEEESEEEASSTEEEPGMVTAAVEETAPRKKQRLTIFVGNLPFQTTDSEVLDLFAEYGTVELVSVPRNRETGQARGFAFVDMATREEMDRAIEGVNGIMYGGRTIRAAESLPKDQVKKNTMPDNEEGVRKIYVGNLPFEADRDSLIEFYSQYGTVRDTYIPLDMKTGRPRGFAFLTMDEDDVDTAIEETNGQMFMGRPLAVSVPLPRRQKAPPRPASYGDRTKLYVGNLSFYTDLDTLRDFFEEFGTVHDCYMPEDRVTGETRGFAFVTMDRESAETAIDEADGYELDGRIIRVNQAQPKGASTRDDFYSDDQDDDVEEEYDGYVEDSEDQESDEY